VTHPDNLTYAVDDVPPLPELIFLGLQQVMVISIYLVMVAIVVRAAGTPAEVAQSAVSLGMLALAIGVVLQALWKGPLGSGYLAAPVFSAVYLHPSLAAVAMGGLPLVFGMTMCAGLFEMLLSRLLRHLRAVFPTVVCGFIVMAVGIELGLIGAKQWLVVNSGLAGEARSLHIAVATLTLAVMVGLAVWGRGLVRLLSALLGLSLGCGVAFTLGFVAPQALQSIREAPFFGVPRLSHLSYAFHPAMAVPFLIAGLAAALRTIGVITTCQRINDVNWKRPDRQSIAGGVLADGLSCSIGGALGVIGMATAPSAVGVSQATGATSRYIAFAIAGWFGLFACMPKLAACFLALPDSVVGGALVFTGSMMLVSGIQIIAAHQLDIRKTMVVGISLLLGLTHETFPGFYQTLPAWLRIIADSILSIATVSAVLLNLLFRVGIRKTSTATIETDQESRERLEQMIRQEGKTWGVTTDVVEEANATAKQVLNLIEEGHLADGPLTARINFDEVSFVVDIHYSGDLLRLPANRPHSDLG
jgi:xanthine permease XanP